MGGGMGPGGVRARGDGRGPRRRPYRDGLRVEGRLPLAGDERSIPVRGGGGPGQPAGGSAGGRRPSRGAPPGPYGGRGRRGSRPVGGGLRRGGRRSGGCPGP